MADMIARQNISGADGRISEVDDLRPANQREDSSNQPPAEMREKSLHVGQGGHEGILGSKIGILPIGQDHTRTTGSNRVQPFRSKAQVGSPFGERVSFNHQKYLFGFSPCLCHLLTLQVMVTTDPKRAGGKFDIWMAIHPEDWPV